MNKGFQAVHHVQDHIGQYVTQGSKVVHIKAKYKGGADILPAEVIKVGFNYTRLGEPDTIKVWIRKWDSFRKEYMESCVWPDSLVVIADQNINIKTTQEE